MQGSRFGVVALVGVWAAITMGSPARDRARVAFSTPISKLDGSHLKATLVEVHYGPGESSKQHTHGCPVIGYVTEGAIRTQVKDEPEAIYHAGQGFYEAANGVHTICANLSQTEAATFIAYFLCDHDAELSADLPHGGSN